MTIWFSLIILKFISEENLVCPSASISISSDSRGKFPNRIELKEKSINKGELFRNTQWLIDKTGIMKSTET